VIASARLEAIAHGELFFKMATAGVLRSEHVPSFNTLSSAKSSLPGPSQKRKFSSISSSVPPEIAAMAVEPPKRLVFDPSKHMNYSPPKKIFSMADIGRGHQGISPHAVSDPFPLFTKEAIQQMRNEILSTPVLENCQYSSNLAACQLRGFAPK